MAMRALVRRINSGKLPVSIQCHNLHSFKEGVILLCQSIFETRRISHLFSSAFFTTSLTIKSGFCQFFSFASVDFENLMKTFMWISLCKKYLQKQGILTT